MTTIREAAQQALDVLIRASSYYDTYAEVDALRAALAQPEQEPVAWMYINAYGEAEDVGLKKSQFGATPTVPLYTAPPKRKWQGLSDEEIHDCFQQGRQDKAEQRRAICHAIEAKLKEKNA